MSTPYILQNIWSECIDLLNQNFIYDKIFDLLDYDNNLDNLYTELSALKKKKYESNYRFIFLHFDTDYYLFPNLPGVLIVNLQQILAELDIPNYFCLIITNHKNIDSELAQVCQLYTTDDYAISSIFTQLQYFHTSPHINDIELNSKDISLSYSCLNFATRSHRHFLIKLLATSNLLHKGLVSYVA